MDQIVKSNMRYFSEQLKFETAPTYDSYIFYDSEENVLYTREDMDIITLCHEVGHIATCRVLYDYKVAKGPSTFRDVNYAITVFAHGSPYWFHELCAGYMGYWIGRRYNLAKLNNWLDWFATPLPLDEIDTKTHPSFPRRQRIQRMLVTQMSGNWKKRDPVYFINL